jgi:hypothetical protein
MSTDYGLRCIECDADLVLEGLHKWGAEIARDRRALIRTLYVSAVALEADVSTYWLPGGAVALEQLSDFIGAHEGHTLVVVDEYGGIHNE